MTHDRARAAVAVFLHRAAGEGARAVIVVTGKGRYPAPGHGVLKRALPDWLAEANLRGLIAGYAAAHRRHGGDGAYYVFLKRVE
jgi:DNA-nicking Smr family endonuclease